MRIQLLHRSTTLALVAGLLLALAPVSAHADPVSDLEAQIRALQLQLASINAQSASVSGQIATTQVRIGLLQAILVDLNSQLLTNNAVLSQNQGQLDSLVKQEAVLADNLATTQLRLDERRAAFSSQVRVLDKVEAQSPLSLLLTSHSFSQFMQRLTGIKQVSDGTHQLAVALRQDRDALASDQAALDRKRIEQAAAVASVQKQKQALEQEYATQNSATIQLEDLRSQLGQEQAQLISQANGVTSQIASAEAQINSLLAFSSGQGGGNIVSPEYLFNSWGSYYNQRDARWGGMHVGNSPYTVWEIGCLLSSVAMVNTHFGFNNVTPGVIAADPANFTSGGLLYNAALNVPGHPAAINQNPSREWINQYLASGGTVIVGMYIRSGGTHFVVLVAQNGPNDYWINDPWSEDAMHVSYNGSSVTGPIYDAIGYR